ncbi:MAG: polysaccharide biosynthesis C-terminal domain-containing protein [Lachnospiraceae bacterium]
MQNSASKGNYLRQAGILATVGIICRIIGILYRSPLTSIIGNEGNGYYTSAYNIYTIVLLLSSYSIPSAVSKVISAKLALREYENAHRIFKGALLYVLVAGAIGSLFTFFGAGFFLEGDAAIVLKVFAPTIFISGFVGVLRGYFQAHGTMVQTSVSQVVEQIMNAVVSLWMAYTLISLVKGQGSTKEAIYGAAGSALGTGSGVVIALLFMLFVYMLNRKLLSNRRKQDRHHIVESYPQIMRIIMTTVTPILISTFIYNFSTSFNQVVFTKTMTYMRGFDFKVATTIYGVFGGRAMVILNIPIAVSAAIAAAMIPAISASTAVGNKKEVRVRTKNAIWTTSLIAIPSAIGLMVLSRPVMQLLFPQQEYFDLASQLLMMISPAVVFYSLSTLSNGILQGVGKVNLPVRNAAIALAVQTLLLVLLLSFTDLEIYALVVSLLVYSGLMCILNSISIHKHTGYRNPILKIYLLPLLSAVIMGAAARLTYTIIYELLESNLIALIPAIILAVLVYFVMILLTGAVEEEQLILMPKGRVLVRAARKLHLLKK